MKCACFAAAAVDADADDDEPVAGVVVDGLVAAEELRSNSLDSCILVEDWTLLMELSALPSVWEIIINNK